jgi:methylenetetrahydrofolate dehydrogenase (NADP+) / methenyltetrahydrofolate cyclohydrolase
MSAQLIDGKAIAAQLRAKVAAQALDYKNRHAQTAGLAVVLVGSDPASQVYVRSKVKMTTEAGLRSIEHVLPVETSEADLLALVAHLNADPAIDGILVQLPLPKQINAEKIIAAIDPDKDVDGFHPFNVGRLATGTGGLVPCTPLGSLMLLKSVCANPAGMEAIVIGRSNIVGKPMAQLLLAESCTVTMAHSRSHDLPALCRRADIVVAAVGRPDMVRGDWIKSGAIVIDVGINRIADPQAGDGKTRLVGDVAFAEAAERASLITPVPGGVGPMTIACLLANTLTAAAQRRGWKLPQF